MTETESLILTNQVAIAAALCIVLDAVTDKPAFHTKRGLARLRLTDMIQTTRLVLDRPEPKRKKSPRSNGPQGCSCPCGFHGDDFCKSIGCPRDEPGGKR